MWTTAAACLLALGLCLCSLPPRGYSVHCSLRDPVIIEPCSIAPKITSSVTPLFSENQTLILIKAYKAPHDLPPWHLCLIPFHSPLLHSRSSSNTRSSCCSNRPGMLFLQPLLNASLSQKVSLKRWEQWVMEAGNLICSQSFNEKRIIAF